MACGSRPERNSKRQSESGAMSSALPGSDGMLTLTLTDSPDPIRPPSGEIGSLLRPGWSVHFLAWIARFSAVVNLVCSFVPGKPQIFHWLVPWMPFEICEGRHIRMFLMSVLLFTLASGLMRGKRAAWLCTIAVLAVVPALHLGHAVIWPQVLVNYAVIGLLVLNHEYFVAGSDRKALQLAFLFCPILALSLLFFATVRLHDLRDETSGGDDWLACFQTAIELEVAHRSDTQQAQTTTSTNFFSILRAGGTSIALLGLALALRPVLLRHKEPDENAKTAFRLIRKYGKDPHDSYALLNDKQYFFTENERAVVPYVLSGNFAVALADPIGPPEMYSMAISAFTLFCRRRDWEPVFYAVADELRSDYNQAGLSLFKIGEEARLRADDFQLKGQDFQNLRTLRNRARRLGIEFRWYHGGKGYDKSLEHQLAIISQRWLEEKHAREMTFDMGSFSIDDIRRDGAAIAIGPNRKALAFATWRPFAQNTGRALDLMRALTSARNVMDFVLIESIAYFNARAINDIIEDCITA